jgi:hypothetical protein
MTTNKTVQNDSDVMTFIAQIKDEKKREDCIEIMSMMQNITAEKPSMWGSSIIGFGCYHYRYESGREGDCMRVGLSPRAQNISVYIIPGFSEFSEHLANLGKHKVGKSCLYIKRLSDIDPTVLRDIIQRSIDMMAERYPN